MRAAVFLDSTDVITRHDEIIDIRRGDEVILTIRGSRSAMFALATVAHQVLKMLPTRDEEDLWIRMESEEA